MNNIYLIGMMGSGKSVTAAALGAASGTDYSFVDLDQRLEQAAGKTIPRIFEEDGEPSFRKKEKEILKEAAKGSRQIVATGGGVVLDPENVGLMKRTGKVVYLETSAEWLWKRVQGNSSRPLLKGKDSKGALSEILENRRPLYEKAADFQVNTDAKDPGTVAKEIFLLLNLQEKR